ncbi:hypothetical protein EG329_008460 [Mollisiaceae sp. DMI_Dod_QoI]|nr:hypothetical protein EG329_008460 [Helotiales sp. DMI_Dod_QoI]
MLEALVAIGLAGNVIQFVQYAGEMISQAKAIRKSGSPSSLPDLRKLTESLTKQAYIIEGHLEALNASQSITNEGNAPTPRSQEDQHLLDVALDCRKTGDKFLAYLDTLFDPTDSRNIIRSAKLSVKFKWAQHRIDEFTSKLDKFRSVLSLATILALRVKTNDHNQVIQEHLQALKTDSQGRVLQESKGTMALQALVDIIQLQSGPRAGSGKSTLMKFIVDDCRTEEALRRWAGDKQFLVINFFWNLGTLLQKSNVGMLWSLIHSVLEKYFELIPAVLPELNRSWKDSGPNSDADREPSQIEIKKAFDLLTSKTSRFLKLCIFIDGIDEFEGDHKEMTMFLISLAAGGIKVVVLGRLIRACINSFRDCPTLRLQDLTKPDMELYVKSNLSSHRSMVELIQRFPQHANDIVNKIKTKATGVFLWVKIVVRLLIDRLEEGDDIADLQNKLRQLPPDLRDLYRRIMGKMQPEHQAQAAEIFQPFHAWNLSIVDQSLRILVMSLAMQPPSEALGRKVKPLETDTIQWLCQNAEARIRSRCCGLIEVHKKVRETCLNNSSATPSYNQAPKAGLHYLVSDVDTELTIEFLHRIVAEFLISSDVWNEICEMTKNSTFNAYFNFACGCLSLLKTQDKVLAHKGPSTQRQYAGQSVVLMQRVDSDKSKPVNYQSYVDTLCYAIICFFDCKFYSTTKYSALELTFYSIAENTAKKAERDGITAEVKKEEAERLAQLARLAPFPKTLSKLSSPEPATNVDASGDINGGPAVVHNDACNTMWLDSKGMEDDGPNATSGSPDRSSEDGIEPDFKVEDEYDVNFEDLDEEISRLIKPKPLSSKGSLGLYSTPPAPNPQSNVPSPSSKREPAPASSAKMEQKSSEPQELEPEVESKWASHMQLVIFRAIATKIANGYLEEKGVKLRRRSARSIVIRDWNAYDQGVRDSKKIDVHRKRLEG